VTEPFVCLARAPSGHTAQLANSLTADERVARAQTLTGIVFGGT